MTMTGHRDMRQIVRRIDIAQPDEKHECAVVGCANYTLNGYVACRQHWLTLPRDIRATLAEAFRQRETRPELYTEAVTVARRLVNLAVAS